METIKRISLFVLGTVFFNLAIWNSDNIWLALQIFFGASCFILDRFIDNYRFHKFIKADAEAWNKMVLMQTKNCVECMIKTKQADTNGRSDNCGPGTGAAEKHP